MLSLLESTNFYVLAWKTVPLAICFLLLMFFAWVKPDIPEKKILSDKASVWVSLPGVLFGPLAIILMIFVISKPASYEMSIKDNTDILKGRHEWGDLRRDDKFIAYRIKAAEDMGLTQEEKKIVLREWQAIAIPEEKTIEANKAASILMTTKQIVLFSIVAWWAIVLLWIFPTALKLCDAAYEDKSKIAASKKTCQ